jgi:prevent-host-death family protein
MAVINIHAAKTHLSRLVDRAAGGEEIVIGRAGKPVAKLVAYTEAVKDRQLGLARDRIWISDDFDGADEEIIRMFEESEP